MQVDKIKHKSPSISSVDSGLDNSTKKASTKQPKMNVLNYNKQLQQASNLSAKKQMLRKSLIDANKKAQGLLEKFKKEESGSDEEHDCTFAPQAVSTQIIKNESESSSSEDDNPTIRPRSNITQSPEQPKIRILDNQVVSSENEHVSSQQSSSSENEERHGTEKLNSMKQRLSLKKTTKNPQKSSENDESSSEEEMKHEKQSSSDDSSSSDSEEDEHSEEQDETRKNSTSSKDSNEATPLLEHFLKVNPEYKSSSLPPDSLYKNSSGEGDQQMYLLQIPKSVPLQNFTSFPFPVKKKAKLKIEGSKYVLKPQPDVPELHILTENTLRKVTPTGVLRIEKYIKTKAPDEVVVERKEKQPLPDSLKVRHPLFGSDYESKIQLEEEIKEKIRQALDRFNVKTGTKKKKKKNKEQEEDKSLLISKLLEEKISNVTNRKEIRVKQEHDSSSRIQEFQIKKELNDSYSETENTVTTKKKKKHRDPEHRIVVKQELDEITEDVPKKKKKKRQEILSTECEETKIPMIVKEEQVETKKKKRKHEEFNEISEHEAQENSKKKKREIIEKNTDVFERTKKRKIPSSTFIDDETPDFKFDVSEIQLEPHSRKRKKNKEKSTENVLINSLLDTMKNNLETTPSKKKHKSSKK